jgi:hypothetical protein
MHFILTDFQGRLFDLGRQTLPGGHKRFSVYGITASSGPGSWLGNRLRKRYKNQNVRPSETWKQPVPLHCFEAISSRVGARRFLLKHIPGKFSHWLSRGTKLGTVLSQHTGQKIRKSFL